MTRREFITLLGGTALTSRSGTAVAQGARPARVGFISAIDQAADSDFTHSLREGLAALGYAEPATLKLDLLFADYSRERIPALLEELERRRVDVIVTHAGATFDVVKGKRTIPAVYEFSADPVTLGIATDLAHPLDNATGISLMAAELNDKRLELLQQIAPEIRRIAVVANSLHPGVQLERAVSEASAQKLNMQVSFFATPNRAQLDRALGSMEAERPEALLLFSDAFIVDNRHYILNFTMSRRIPVITGWAVMAESGALCTYGPRLSETYRRTAYFVDRILKGAKPAELPIEQPTVLELVVNLNSAKTLGITVPPAVLVRADRVIE